MKAADALVPIWHQGICSHHIDLHTFQVRLWELQHIMIQPDLQNIFNSSSLKYIFLPQRVKCRQNLSLIKMPM